LASSSETWLLSSREREGVVETKSSAEGTDAVNDLTGTGKIPCDSGLDVGGGLRGTCDSIPFPLFLELDLVLDQENLVQEAIALLDETPTMR